MVLSQVPEKRRDVIETLMISDENEGPVGWKIMWLPPTGDTSEEDKRPGQEEVEQRDRLLVWQIATNGKGDALNDIKDDQKEAEKNQVDRRENDRKQLFHEQKYGPSMIVELRIKKN